MVDNGKPHKIGSGSTSHKSRPESIEGAFGEYHVSHNPNASSPKAKEAGFHPVDMLVAAIKGLYARLISSPHNMLEVNTLLDGDRSQYALHLDATFAALGPKLKTGKGKKGNDIYRTYDAKLAKHIKSLFEGRENRLQDIGVFMGQVKTLRRALGEQYRAVQANPQKHAETLSVLRDKMAAADAILYSCESIIADELFKDMATDDILQRIPLYNSANTLPDDVESKNKLWTETTWNQLESNETLSEARL